MEGSAGRNDGGVQRADVDGQRRVRSGRSDRGGVEEYPGRERHAVPGQIPGGRFHEYRYVRETEDDPIAEDGGVGWLASDEWLAYDVAVESAGEHALWATVAAEADYGGGAFGVVVDQTPLKAVQFDPTGGWYAWETVGATIELPQGLHTLRLVVLEGGWNLAEIAIE